MILKISGADKITNTGVLGRIHKELNSYHQENKIRVFQSCDAQRIISSIVSYNPRNNSWKTWRCSKENILASEPLRIVWTLSFKK